MKIDNWFTAIVVDLADPLQAGRAKIRCYEYHEIGENSELKDADLPWAMPIMPLTSASSGGVGASATGLKEGSWVLGFFRDTDLQDPVIIGSVPGIEALNGKGIPADAESSSVGDAYSKATDVSQYNSSNPSANGANTNTMDGGTTVPPLSGDAASRIIQAANSQVGVRSPGKQAYWDAVGWNGLGNHWCAAFVTWCVKTAGVLPEASRPKTASALHFYNAWAGGAGKNYSEKIVNPSVVYAGDIVSRHRGAVGSGFGHVGLISVGSDASGMCETIEGNTGSPSGVHKRRKSIKEWKYVVRLKNTSGDSSASSSPIAQNTTGTSTAAST
jgi:hypothetical protein